MGNTGSAPGASADVVTATPPINPEKQRVIDDIKGRLNAMPKLTESMKNHIAATMPGMTEDQLRGLSKGLEQFTGLLSTLGIGKTQDMIQLLTKCPIGSPEWENEIKKLMKQPGKEWMGNASERLTKISETLQGQLKTWGVYRSDWLMNIAKWLGESNLLGMLFTYWAESEPAQINYVAMRMESVDPAWKASPKPEVYKDIVQQLRPIAEEAKIDEKTKDLKFTLLFDKALIAARKKTGTNVQANEIAAAAKIELETARNAPAQPTVAAGQQPAAAPGAVAGAEQINKQKIEGQKVEIKDKDGNKISVGKKQIGAEKVLLISSDPSAQGRTIKVPGKTIEDISVKTVPAPGASGKVEIKFAGELSTIEFDAGDLRKALVEPLPARKNYGMVFGSNQPLTVELAPEQAA